LPSCQNQVKFVKVGNPFGIFFVRLLPLDGFDIFGVGKTDFHVVFEIIKNRNPVFSCGFHTNMITMILDKPVVELLNTRVDG